MAQAEPHKPSHRTMTRGGQTVCMVENCESYLTPVEKVKQTPIAKAIEEQQ